MENSNKDYIQVDNITGKTDSLTERKKKLWAILGLSAFLDVAISTGTLTAGMVLPGINIVVDELIENIISRTIAQVGLKQKLDWLDQAVGFVPIPGVTALTVRCARELLTIYKAEKAVG